MAVLEVDRLTRTFRSSDGTEILALKDVSFSVEMGSNVALLGRNGAGKSTLAKIISTLLLPSSGSVQICGHDVASKTRDARGQISVVFGGDRGLYGLLSARENLRYLGALGGVSARDLRKRIPAVLDEVGLGADADRRVEEYSKGMRQRLHIAVGLLSRPRLLVLDEPTVGLDPLEAARLREKIASLRDQEVTVLLMSHVLLDVDQLADRVLMIDRGHLVHDLSPREFASAAGYSAKVSATVRSTKPLPVSDLRWSVSRETGLYKFETQVAGWNAEVLSELSIQLAGWEVIDLDVRPATLDEAFTALARVTA